MWIYGEPFSGKTKFATEFPKPVVLSTDGNAKHYKCTMIRVKNFEEFSKEFDNLVNKKNDYETIIIDVNEHLQDFIRTYQLKKMGIEHESEHKGFGVSWALVRDSYLATVKRIFDIDDKNVILISHEQAEINVDGIGRETTKFKPAIDDTKHGMHAKIASFTDFYGRVYKTQAKDGVITYNVSFGQNSNEVSGVRVPIKKLLIENTYKAFADNLKGENK